MPVLGAIDYGPTGTSLGGKSLEQFKASFFDADAVVKAMDKTTRQALSKAGAFVRQRMKTSIRYRKAPAPIGSPPSAHRSAVSGIKRGNTFKKNQPTSPLRDFIFFAYEAWSQSVVIGPARTNQRNAQALGDLTIPEILEYGGTEVIFEHLTRSGEWVRTDLRYRISQGPRSAVNRPTRQRRARYGPRPYANPALEAEHENILKFFEEAGF